MTWHDGKPLTADDVVASIRTWTSAQNYSAGLASTIVDVARVRTRGPLTVEVPLKIPLAAFPAICAYYQFYITRPDVYETGVVPVGTGPFKYRSFNPGQRSVFIANKDYWGGAPYIDQQIADSSFSADTARLDALLSGSIDIMPSLPFGLAKPYASNNSQIYIGHAVGSAIWYFSCRVDLAPFNDPRVMLALKLLCDRRQMVQSVFSGYAKESNDLMGPGLPYYAGPSVFPIHQYDPERARSLLKAAGWANLTHNLLTSNLTQGWIEGATVYAAQAAAAGVKLDLVPVEGSIYYTPQGPEGGYLRYPMFTEVYYSTTTLALTYLLEVWSKGPYNQTHYGDAYTDKLMFDAMAELDEAKAQEKWYAVQKLQYDRGGSVIFGNAAYVDGYAKHVRGARTTPSGWLNNNDVSKAWLAA